MDSLSPLVKTILQKSKAYAEEIMEMGLAPDEFCVYLDEIEVDDDGELLSYKLKIDYKGEIH